MQLHRKMGCRLTIGFCRPPPRLGGQLKPPLVSPCVGHTQAIAMTDQVKALLNRVREVSDFCYVTFDDINATNALGDNALHCVCVWGDIEAARILIDGGIDINKQGEFGFTPLAIAEQFDHAGIAGLLRSLGAIRAGSLSTPLDRRQRAAHLQGIAEEISVLQKRLEGNDR